MGGDVAGKRGGWTVMRTAEARSVVRDLMAYPMKSIPMHQDSGHKGRPPALLYQYEHALGQWFEIEGDVVRYCQTDSSDGGQWGFDKGRFYVTCFYHETSDRPDLLARVQQLHWENLHRPTAKGKRNAYLAAKGY